MKIAYVYDVIYPYITGGVEKRIWEVSKRLAAKGHDVHVYGMKHWKGDATFKKDGVTFHGVCRPVGLYTESGRRSIRQVLLFSLLLPFKLFRQKYDLVDCQASPYMPAFVARIYCFLRGVPMVMTWHEFWGEYWNQYLGPFGYIGRLMEYVCTRMSPHVIAVSESTKRQLTKRRIKTVAVVPNGVDISYIDTVTPAEPSDILFVGRLIKDKNVDKLLEAVAVITEKTPHIKAVIVGAGPEKNRLEERANQIGLKLVARFIGSQPYERVIGLMKSSKVFVFPSTREGFGIVILEAFACGLPVVTVKHERNAAADLIISGTNGFVTGLNTKEIAQEARKILSDDNLRGWMGQKAREQALGYDWDRITEKLETEYNITKRGKT